MVRLVPLCLALLGAFGEHSPPHAGATCDEELQDEFSTLQVASKLQSIAAEEVQKRDDTKTMKKEDENDEDEEVEEEDEVGKDEDEEDVEAVAALQKGGVRRRGKPVHRRRRRGWDSDLYGAVRRRREPAGAGRRRREPAGAGRRRQVAALQTESRQENPDVQDEVQKRDDTKRMKNKEDEDDEDEEGEDEEDEVGEDEDEEDVEAVAALQTAKSFRRRRTDWFNGVYQGKRRRRSKRRSHRRRVAALQAESRQENPDLQDDVIFLDEIEDNFGAYMHALREFQANRELLTRQDKQAMVNKLRQGAVAEADEMIKLGDLVAVNEAELEGEEDAEEAAGEEDDEKADHNEDHEEAAGDEESKSDQETTLDMPALTSVMAPS